MFGIDLRSLAAFRVAAASILLLDLWYRSRDLAAFFTDQGILPRQARIGLVELGDQFGRQHAWSLHMLSGEWWAQAVLLLIAALFGVWLLIGYRTRLAAVVSWVLLLSLDTRNPAILNSGDVLLRCLLFWSLFLPLGARASIDRLFWKKTPAPSDPPADSLADSLADPPAETPANPSADSKSNVVTNVASAGMLLQLGMMYFFSALFKTHPVWHTEMSAVYFALNCDAYTTPLAVPVRQFPGLMKALTLGSYLLELLGPIVVFTPFWTARVRVVVVGLFWLFHVSLGLVMTLGLFPAICMAGWLVYLPSSFWDWLAATGLGKRACRLAAASADHLRDFRTRHPRWLACPANPNPPRGRIASLIVNGLLAALLVYVVVWNVRELDIRYWEPLTMSRHWNGIGRALGFDQNWSMFSPIPRTEDGWLIMLGTLEDGTEVNLWQPGRPIPWEKPRLVSATYLNQRWRKYLDNLTTDPYIGHRDYFCEWLAARWNARNASQDPAKRVAKVELLHRVELTPPPGDPIPEPETKQLYVFYPIYYD